MIGTFIGIIPGVGEDVGAWTSYAAAKRFSKHPEEFGKGSQEGLIAAETGDNAVIPGAMIPTLTLAIPGSAASAVLIAAMFIHGIRPGPMLMIENPTFLYQVVAMLLLATVAILVYGLSLTRLFIKVLLVPRERLMAVVYVLCLVGAFAITQRMFDVYVMLVFGVVGFVLREMKYPMAPLVLGIILGDLIDINLRRGLLLSDGDPSPFFTRPISLMLFLVIVASVLLSVPAVKRRAARLSPPPARPAEVCSDAHTRCVHDHRSRLPRVIIYTSRCVHDRRKKAAGDDGPTVATLLCSEMLPEEVGDLSKGFFRFRNAIIELIVACDWPSKTTSSASTPARRSLRCTRTVLLRSRSRVPVVRIAGGNPCMSPLTGDSRGSARS